ncbi:hypothetical protein FLONG3_5868 [Fusarium longipes]|uniref:Uncharacterized protein n=1 Tax=Fusarium longipes TaxID=694270 RepID=A0A395SSL1_9HYPO|nr:hypothetical protein FLONG3_5868 [Fusarium longipes]
MTTFSCIPSHVLGAACVGRGIMALFSPRAEYGHMGILLEPGKIPSEAGSVSPLMYFKAIREISYGATLMALQWQGSESAVTTFSAILSIVRISDGLVVWVHGGDELRYKAAGHWITALGFLGWVIWRWGY